MNKNVGASFTLSVLVVLFFAVALYQPESRIRQASAGAVAAKTAPNEDSEAGPEPGQRSDEPPSPPPIVTPTSHRESIQRNAPTHPPAKSVARPAPVAPPQRGAFTSVLKGETLADVARRVYGPLADTNVLWLANRDLLGRKDATLSQGMVLRTP